MKKIITLAFVVLISGCTTFELTSSGKKVKLTKREPKNCKYIDDIEAKACGWDGCQGALQVKKVLRNKTAELGGNVVVLDTIGKGNTNHVSMTGRAFKCSK
jgi:hypothetical protein